ncbi:MAG: hypothetical protein ACOCYB_08220 [Alkalispirochaeta sp.]
MINSLLELVGALFLASLPILLTLARIRRRRMRAAAREAAGRGTSRARDGRDHRRAPGWRSWLSQLLERSPDRDLAPFPEQGGAASAPTGRGQTRRQAAPETESGLEQERSHGYRSLPQSSPGDALLKRVGRYPPLQRAIVLKEILGPPKGLD